MAIGRRRSPNSKRRRRDRRPTKQLQSRAGADVKVGPSISQRRRFVHVKATLGIAAVVLMAPLSAGSQVLTERNISLQLALSIAQAAMNACKTDGYDVSVAVVDRAGDLKVLLRADTANPHN